MPWLSRGSLRWRMYVSARSTAPRPHPKRAHTGIGMPVKQFVLALGTSVLAAGTTLAQATADVHVVSTSQGTAGGGTEHTFAFLGQQGADTCH